ncbi:MAG: hypothetical protein A3K10_02530 [Bacteroidetes bacterium RIFCSPLOWO2_12_FULL_31_6]|nr:MAG: hypothetical protein A3K10_02530 [Bacteroidetes bacterium RIFCSPLOWO2_12_FULL_31_6]
MEQIPFQLNHLVNREIYFFFSNINAVNISAFISLFNYKRKFAFTPYLLAGIGIFNFNPMVQINNEWIELQPLGTEGQFISSGNYPDPYKLWQINLPLGFGISYKITKAIEINLDATYHKTFTDYIDDVSGNYPNMVDLANTTNGDLAIILSNRSGVYVDETTPRGNPKAMDGFVNFDLSITIYPFEFPFYSSDKNNTKKKYTNTIKNSDCKKLKKRLKI